MAQPSIEEWWHLAGTLREHCEDLLFQGTDGYSCNYVLEEKIAFVRPKCIDYATVRLLTRLMNVML